MDEPRRVAEALAARVLAEPPRWCSTQTYAFTVVLSTTMTVAAHAAVRRLSSTLWQHDIDLDSRVVSTLNAMLLLAIYRPNAWWHTSSYDAVVGNDCHRDVCMLSLVGYLTIDAIICARILCRRSEGGTNKPGSYADPLVLAHHALVSIAFVVGITTRLATTYMAALIINELSTPFINLRVLINAIWPPTQDRPPSIDLMYLLNGIALLVTYFFARVLWTFFIVLRVAFAWRQLWRVGLLIGGYRLYTVAFLSFLLAGHLLINLLWFANIIAHLGRLIARHRRDRRLASQSTFSTDKTARSTFCYNGIDLDRSTKFVSRRRRSATS